MRRHSPLVPFAGRRPASARPRNRRPAPRFDRLEARTLLTVNFTDALGFGPPPGASGQAVPRAVAIDSGGATIVAGTIRGGTINFNPDPGGPQRDATNASQIFVAKYSPAGTLIWYRTIGDGSTGATNGAYDVAVDGAGNVYATGEFSGNINFNTDPQGTPKSYSVANRADGFIWKLDPNGNYIWAQVVDSSLGSFADGYGLAVDAAANPSVFITGTFGQRIGDTATFGATTLTTGGSSDAFVARLNPDGSYAWAKDFHTTAGLGPNFTFRKGIALDSADNVYTTGQFGGTVDFDPARVKPAGIKVSNGSSNVYVAKLDSAGSFVWADAFGGPGFSQGVRLAVDSAAGAVYAFGEYQGATNFNPNPSGTPQVLNSPDGLFVTKLNTGGAFLFARDLGVTSVNGRSSSFGPGDVRLDPGGNLDIIGSYFGNVRLGNGAYSSPAGSPATFFARMNSAGQFLETAPLPGAGSNTDLAIAVNASGTIALTGSYIAGATPLALGVFNLPAAVSGSTNAFVATIAHHITRGGYDGIARTNLGIFDPTNSTFAYVSNVTGQVVVTPFGYVGHHNIPLVGDYNGTGRSNTGIYDPTSATFAYYPTVAGGVVVKPFGYVGHFNIPLVGDYDGTGKTNIGIYDEGSATFAYISNPSGRVVVVPFGFTNHFNIPLAGDYDGTGRTNVGIYDVNSATFAYISNVTHQVVVSPFGFVGHGNVPLFGDYDGDGKTDIGIYDPTNSTFAYIQSSTGQVAVKVFGYAGHNTIPLVGDFDGDGKTDIGIYDPTNVTFAYLQSGNGQVVVKAFGYPGHGNYPIGADLPLDITTTTAPGAGGRAIVVNSQAVPSGPSAARVGAAPGTSTPAGGTTNATSQARTRPAMVTSGTGILASR